ncbi:hypothetical protein DR64_6897 [Paraburkholderia xenovorans LB400]|nr:hypothetical protein DR64_6897 [Paraburkholderia xenovorans LB400]
MSPGFGGAIRVQLVKAFVYRTMTNLLIALSRSGTRKSPHARVRCFPVARPMSIRRLSATVAFIYPPDVGLPARTTLLDSANCTAVFRLADNRVAFGWNGVMVRAIRKP